MDNTSQAAEKLLCWYGRNVRALPWRLDVSPYHVWLSEIMLQQTRVETATGYYERFLEALPDVESLSKAPEDTCLKLWQGLGYYSRVRNLQKAAKVLMQRYNGSLPGSIEELVKLPGIGEYTAAAIASIAFEQAQPAIDGNLLRVFARLTAYGEDISSQTAKQSARAFFLPLMKTENLTQAGRHVLASVSESLGAPLNLPGTINQALMDLGSGVCLPNGEPLCAACPLRDFCLSHKQGNERHYPVKTPPKPRTIENRTVLLIRYGEKIVLRKRPAKGLLAGLYELPNTKGSLSQQEALAYARKLGFSPLRIMELPPAKHIFTHREWHMIGYELRADELAPLAAAEDENAHWLLAGKDEIQSNYSIPSPFTAYLIL